MEGLTQEQQAEMRNNYAIFDADGDGLISLEDLSTTFDRLGLDYSEAYTRSVFNAADVDGDGFVDLIEFVSLLTGSDGDAAVRGVFRMLDTANAGTLTAPDVHAGMLRLGINVTEDEVKAMVEEMDADGNGAVDFQEFKTVWIRLSTADPSTSSASSSHSKVNLNSSKSH